MCAVAAKVSSDHYRYPPPRTFTSVDAGPRLVQPILDTENIATVTRLI
jgi:hypothetical protein